MPFTVIESFVCGKWGEPARCEDIIVVTEHFAAVIDGATSRRPDVTIAGLTPGRFAALTGQSVLEVLSPSATAAEAVASMSQQLRIALVQADMPAEGQPGAIFGFVAYSSARREIWRVADCSFAWDRYCSAPRLEAERVPVEARAMLLQSLILSGADVASLRDSDPAAPMIAPLIEAQAWVRNRLGTPWSFGAIDGQDVPLEFIEVFPVPNHIREIVLASDGWPELRPTLAESEALLASVLQEDPLMIRRFPATKGVAPGAVSFDDRAYLRLRLT